MIANGAQPCNRIVIPANAGIQNGRCGNTCRILDTGVRRYDEFGADGMSCWASSVIKTQHMIANGAQPCNRIVIPANAGIQNGRCGNASRILDAGVRRYDEFGADGMSCWASSVIKTQHMIANGAQPCNRIVIPANAGIQNGRCGNTSRILDTGVRRYDEFGADGMSCWASLVIKTQHMIANGARPCNRIVIPANAGIQNGRCGNASRILDTGVRRYDEFRADGMSC